MAVVVAIRPVRPDDAAGLAALYAGLSNEDRRLRFFTQHDLTPSELADYTADDALRFGLVAISDNPGGSDAAPATPAEGDTAPAIPTESNAGAGPGPAAPERARRGRGSAGAVVGHALAVVDPATGDGEFALTVDRAWRGGLGRRLFDALLGEAARRSVRNLVGEILEENAGMLGVARHHGLVVADRPDRGVVRLAVGTGTPTPTWSGDGCRPRVLVEARSWRWRFEQTLRDAGYDVAICPGPRPEAPCPGLAGLDCPMVDGCDAVVVVARADDPVAWDLAAWHAACAPARAVPFIVDAPAGDLPDHFPPGAARLPASGNPDTALATVARLVGRD